MLPATACAIRSARGAIPHGEADTIRGTQALTSAAVDFRGVEGDLAVRTILGDAADLTFGVEPGDGSRSHAIPSSVDRKGRARRMRSVDPPYRYAVDATA